MRKLVCLLALLVAGVAVADIDPKVDTPENREILKKAEKAYNDMRTLKARFAQFNSKIQNDLQSGDIYILKPGNMRLVYEKGSPLEFYAVGGYFIYHDKDAKEVSYFDLEKTPVKLILQNKLSFTDPEFLVTDVQDELDEYFITAVKKEAPELGSLTLVLDKDTMELKQWDVLDIQGVKSTVSLYDIEQNVPVNPDLFTFKNPYRD